MSPACRHGDERPTLVTRWMPLRRTSETTVKPFDRNATVSEHCAVERVVRTAYVRRRPAFRRSGRESDGGTPMAVVTQQRSVSGPPRKTTPPRRPPRRHPNAAPAAAALVLLLLLVTTLLGPATLVVAAGAGAVLLGARSWRRHRTRQRR